MSDWKNYNLEDKLRGILSREKVRHPHLGQSFLSVYQLAIKYDKEFHNDVEAMGYKVGGKGSNVYTSLAQYIGRELSKRIKRGDITDIEGAVLSDTELSGIIFDNDSIVSSVTGNENGLSLFRIKDK
ncbi:hypothetical protein [Candidatus Clostridium helianthi]|jgi:hypothetical protein|uniref:Uncharacterized protein n=1 Tax=Candidatus Clostridium helianthi TaxID=3381660 RepID=A0ABW8SAN3_9CLOT